MSGVQGTPETIGAQSAGLLDFGPDALFYTPKTNRRGIVKTPQMYRLNSPNVGGNVTTVQNLFPKSVTLEANTVYEFEMAVALNKTAGATSHTVTFGYGGTATLNNILRNVFCSGAASAATLVNSVLSNGYLTATSFTNLTGAIAAAAANVWLIERGTISVNAGGTFIPQYQLSAAPGGAYSVLAGSHFWIAPLGAAGADTEIGTWA